MSASIRDGDGLPHALAEIARDRARHARASPQLRNMATAALLVAAAALRAHARAAAGTSAPTIPTADPAQAKRTFMTLDEARAIAAVGRSRAPRRQPSHDLPALPRRVPLAARDRRRGDARARRGSRPRRRRHLDRDRAGRHARRAPSWSRARPARSPACRWSRQRCASSIRPSTITAHQRDGAAVAAQDHAADRSTGDARARARGRARRAEFPRPSLRHRDARRRHS